MLDFVSKVIKSFVGSKADRDLKELTPYVEKILAEYNKLQSLTNDELRAKTTEFKTAIKNFIKEEENKIAQLQKEAENTHASELEKIDSIYKQIDKANEMILQKIEEKLEEILPQAFAVVKETARRFKENKTIEVTATQLDRDLAATKSNVIIQGEKAIHHNTWIAAGNEVTWDMLHYDVQMIGGAVIHKGKIAEMATGEGKTLVATLPVYLNALAGKGVHVVTVNDYLAKRDSEWMGPLFEFHGLTIDCIDKHEPNSPNRRKAYLADITYGTNNEFGFDYLRDNMARETEDLVQRKHHFAIVDEVDSVLIDDARTPLIISGPTPKGDKHEFYETKPRVEKLVNAQRKYVNTVLADAKKLLQHDANNKISKENEEKGGLALLRAYRGLPKNTALIKFLSEPGIKQILLKTENHYMQDQSKEMHKVDAELYFTIDEKNNSIELTDKGIDLMTENSDDPHFFVIPDIGSELVNLEKQNISDQELLIKKDKLIQDYSVKAERIHTVNQLLKAYTLFEKDVEYVIMDGKIKIVDEQTGRIMEGRRYSDGLHQAIEAKENVKVEAATQTYATITLQNYFRMYHKLAGMTGTAETEAGEFWDIYKLDVVVIPTNKPITRKDSEDMVYKTRREKYKAVIDEIEKLVKEGRPVLVGTTSVEISEQLSRTLKMKNIKHNVLNAKLHQKEADIVAEAGKQSAVTIATNMAGRGTDIKLGEGVKEKGGLAIIGTERHESRRVDRQLRGRAGRQGDPGSSQFFVSLEDELMRLFGSERIAKLMDRMGLEEGEVIQHSMITRSIERAQKKVEENNFGIRKRLLEYDDVMNSQRTVIYDRRKHALFGDRLDLDIANMLMDMCESLINEYREQKNFTEFKLELIRVFSIDTPVSEEQFFEMPTNELAELLYENAMKHYDLKKESISKTSFPVIKDVFENQGAQFQNIVVPFTDGIKTIQIVCNLQKAYETNGLEVFKSFEKGAALAMIDNYWKEHLREMDDLKQSVQGAVYEQKDPLLIYKFEAFELFKLLLGKVNRDIITFLMKGNLPNNENSPQTLKQAPQRPTSQPKLQTSRADSGIGNSASPLHGGQPQQQVQKTAPIRVEKKVGRNDPCPCGSGKKYKQCHGKGEE
ncbi:MAG: preprotein translocase subunit SecA [Bacteroidetes bacterium]|nr:preprotein translocase subunit SecA [Bacteroidota bacterium]MBV6460837.1 Protein translocase subunit SecA [Flavobacteriales bacterium]WKZ75838.1 MAG: preprotein translocase subunit SecA [Vicingaceae bacterium]MCL4816618.1 preprotein translocase subunit SecA [Flavobacteriales bacterium]NOG95662.1 preprotein translocase subunit SecA [Bacteroidota bacterium]